MRVKDTKLYLNRWHISPPRSTAAAASLLQAGKIPSSRSLMPFLLLHTSSTDRQLMRRHRQLPTSLPMSSLPRSQSVRLSVCVSLFAITPPPTPPRVTDYYSADAAAEGAEETHNTSEVDQAARAGYRCLSLTHTHSTGLQRAQIYPLTSCK